MTTLMIFGYHTQVTEVSSMDKDIIYLKQLTEELKEEVGNHKGGPTVAYMASLLDKLNTASIMFAKDGYVLHINKYLKDRIIRLTDVSKEELLNYDKNYCRAGLCPFVGETCPMRECAEKNKVVMKYNVKGTLTGTLYNLVCVPLRYNGSYAVVEFWIEVDKNGNGL